MFYDYVLVFRFDQYGKLILKTQVLHPARGVVPDGQKTVGISNPTLKPNGSGRMS